MARIEPLPRDELAAHEAGFAMVEQMMGFVPNSMFTMARVPGLLPAFQGLGAAVLGMVPATPHTNGESVWRHEAMPTDRRFPPKSSLALPSSVVRRPFVVCLLLWC